MMSVFVYLDQNQTPTGVQRFETMPGVDITVPPGALYVEDASVLPSDMEIIDRWRMKAGALSDVGPGPSKDYRWDVTLEQWVPDVARAKAGKLKEIREARDRLEYGDFVWDGSTFDSDPQAQLRIQGAVQLSTMSAAVGQPFSIDWTLADNTVRTLSGADTIAVGMTLAGHVQTVHAIARTLRLQIEAATTLAEVEAVVWP